MSGLSCASYIMGTSALYFTWRHELCAAGLQQRKLTLNQAMVNSFVDATDFSALYVVIRPTVPTYSAGNANEVFLCLPFMFTTGILGDIKLYPKSKSIK